MSKKHRDKTREEVRKAGYFWDPLALLARYFPTFICSIFMCIFSIVMATVLVTRTWFSDHPQRAAYSWLFMMGASLMLTTGGFLLTRGRLWATWILVGILTICLLAVLPTVPTRGQTSDLVAYALGLSFPLLGLLSLNSKRSRELREQLVFNRSARTSLREDSQRQSGRKRQARRK